MELQLFDGNGGVLKQLALPNVAPGASASLTLARSEVTTSSTPRFSIRGVVRTNPVASTAGTTTPVPTGGCPVKATLEIYNNDTGNTQLVTSDVQSISGFAYPLTMMGK